MRCVDLGELEVYADMAAEAQALIAEGAPSTGPRGFLALHKRRELCIRELLLRTSLNEEEVRELVASRARKMMDEPGWR